MEIILPITLFIAWFAIVLAPLGQLAIEDIKAGVPEDRRRGVSIFPGIPVCPLFFWGLSYAIDVFFPPWGTLSILVGHIIVFIIAAYVIIRDILILKRIDPESPGNGC